MACPAAPRLAHPGDPVTEVPVAAGVVSLQRAVPSGGEDLVRGQAHGPGSSGTVSGHQGTGGPDRAGGGGSGEPEPRAGPGQRAGGRARHLAAAGGRRRGRPAPRPHRGCHRGWHPGHRHLTHVRGRRATALRRAGRPARAGFHRGQGSDSVGGGGLSAAVPRGGLVRRPGRPDADPQPGGLAGASADARGRPGPGAGRPDRRHPLLPGRLR